MGQRGEGLKENFHVLTWQKEQQHLDWNMHHCLLSDVSLAEVKFHSSMVKHESQHHHAHEKIRFLW